MVNSVEYDLGCASMIYFDNLMLTLHNVTHTSQKTCQHNNKCDCTITNGILRHLIEKYIKFVYSADKTLPVIRKMDFDKAEPTCYRTNVPYASSGLQNEAFAYIVLRVLRLTCTRYLIRSSNCAGLSQLELVCDLLLWLLLITLTFLKFEVISSSVLWHVSFEDTSSSSGACADPGNFVRGVPGQSDKKSSDNVFFFFFFF